MSWALRGYQIRADNGAGQHIATYMTGKEDGLLLAAAPDLRDALRALLDWIGHDGESINDLYERTAAQFFADTGLLAPGKDSPAAFGDNDQERRARWEAWRQERHDGVRRDARAALAKAGQP